MVRPHLVLGRGRRRRAPARRGSSTWRAISRRSSSTCMKPSVIPRPSDGLVHELASPTESSPVAHGVPSTTNRRWRSTTPAIDSHLADRLAIEPVGLQRARPHDPLVHVGIPEPSQLFVVGQAVQGDRPGAVVGRQREHRERAVRRQRRTHHRRYRAVGRSEVAAVVGEAAVFGLLDRGDRLRSRRASRAWETGGRWRRSRCRRAPPRRTASRNPVTWGTPSITDVPVVQPGDRIAATERDARVVSGRGRQRPLERAAATGEQTEALVVGFGCCVGLETEQELDEVEVESAVVRRAAGRRTEADSRGCWCRAPAGSAPTRTGRRCVGPSRRTRCRGRVAGERHLVRAP